MEVEPFIYHVVKRGLSVCNINHDHMKFKGFLPEGLFATNHEQETWTSKYSDLTFGMYLASRTFIFAYIRN